MTKRLFFSLDVAKAAFCHGAFVNRVLALLVSSSWVARNLTMDLDSLRTRALGKELERALAYPARQFWTLQRDKGALETLDIVPFQKSPHVRNYPAPHPESIILTMATALFVI